MSLLKKPSIQLVDEPVESEFSISQLESMLLSDQVDDRRFAVRGLGNCKGSDNLSTLIALLSSEPDQGVQDLVLQIIKERGGDTVVKLLIPLLRSDDAHLRNAVIDTLQQMPAEMESHMTELLNDEDPDVRIFAINIISSLQHPLVPQWLLQVIQQDEHLNVCMTALDLLAEIGEKSMCADVHKLLTRFPNEPYVSFAVSQVQKRLGCM
jgi:HEAT repeat protein